MENEIIINGKKLDEEQVGVLCGIITTYAIMPPAGSTAELKKTFSDLFKLLK